MNRKTYVIIALVVVLILTGVGAYFFYFKKAPTGALTKTGGAFPGEGMPVTSTTEVSSPETDGEVFTPGGSAPLPRLYELHKLPVAGAGFTETKDKKGSVTSTTVRYIERGLGHIYETPLATYIESRIVNETRSRLSEALWGNNGKSVVIRYFDDTVGTIKTRILNIGASMTSTDNTNEFLNTEELFLPDYISFMSVATDGADKLFYLEKSDTRSNGSLATFKNKGVVQIFNSIFTEWLPQFPNQNLVTLTTKPSTDIPGHLFFLNTKTKVVTKVLSGINGLTTLTDRNGKSVLYAEIKNDAPELAVYDFVKKETYSFALRTLPEKCAWSTKNALTVYCAVPQTLPNAQYPDQWYQGLISFSDEIWKIDTKTGVAEKILSPRDLGAPTLDIINPTLSSNDTYLLFMNKVTGTPWVLRIAPEAPVATVNTTPLATPITSVTEGMQKLR